MLSTSDARRTARERRRIEYQKKQEQLKAEAEREVKANRRSADTAVVDDDLEAMKLYIDKIQKHHEGAANQELQELHDIMQQRALKELVYNAEISGHDYLAIEAAGEEINTAALKAVQSMQQQQQSPVSRVSSFYNSDRPKEPLKGPVKQESSLSWFSLLSTYFCGESLPFDKTMEISSKNDQEKKNTMNHEERIVYRKNIPTTTIKSDYPDALHQLQQYEDFEILVGLIFDMGQFIRSIPGLSATVVEYFRLRLYQLVLVLGNEEDGLIYQLQQRQQQASITAAGTASTVAAVGGVEWRKYAIPFENTLYTTQKRLASYVSGEFLYYLLIGDGLKEELIKFDAELAYCVDSIWHKYQLHPTKYCLRPMKGDNKSVFSGITCDLREQSKLLLNSDINLSRNASVSPTPLTRETTKEVTSFYKEDDNNMRRKDMKPMRGSLKKESSIGMKKKKKSDVMKSPLKKESSVQFSDNLSVQTYDPNTTNIIPLSKEKDNASFTRDIESIEATIEEKASEAAANEDKSSGKTKAERYLSKLKEMQLDEVMVNEAVELVESLAIEDVNRSTSTLNSYFVQAALTNLWSECFGSRLAAPLSEVLDSINASLVKYGASTSKAERLTTRFVEAIIEQKLHCTMKSLSDEVKNMLRIESIDIARTCRWLDSNEADVITIMEAIIQTHTAKRKIMIPALSSYVNMELHADDNQKLELNQREGQSSAEKLHIQQQQLSKQHILWETDERASLLREMASRIGWMVITGPKKSGKTLKIIATCHFLPIYAPKRDIVYIDMFHVRNELECINRINCQLVLNGGTTTESSKEAFRKFLLELRPGSVVIFDNFADEENTVVVDEEYFGDHWDFSEHSLEHHDVNIQYSLKKSLAKRILKLKRKNEKKDAALKHEPSAGTVTLQSDDALNNEEQEAVNGEQSSYDCLFNVYGELLNEFQSHLCFVLSYSCNNYKKIQHLFPKIGHSAQMTTTPTNASKSKAAHGVKATRRIVTMNGRIMHEQYLKSIQENEKRKKSLRLHSYISSIVKNKNDDDDSNEEEEESPADQASAATAVPAVDPKVVSLFIIPPLSPNNAMILAERLLPIDPGALICASQSIAGWMIHFAKGFDLGQIRKMSESGFSHHDFYSLIVERLLNDELRCLSCLTSGRSKNSEPRPVETIKRKFHSSSGMPMPSKIIHKPSVKPFSSFPIPSHSTSSMFSAVLKPLPTSNYNVKTTKTVKRGLSIAARSTNRMVATDDDEIDNINLEGVCVAQKEGAQIIANGIPLGHTLHHTPFDYAYAWGVCKEEFNNDIARWYLAFSHLLHMDLIQEIPFLGFHLPYIYQPIFMIVTGVNNLEEEMKYNQSKQLSLSQSLQLNCISYPIFKSIKIHRTIHSNRYIQYYIAELNRLNNIAYIAPTSAMRSFDHQWIHFNNLLATFFRSNYQENQSIESSSTTTTTAAAAVASQKITVCDLLCFAMGGQLHNFLTLRFDINLAMFICRTINIRIHKIINLIKTNDENNQVSIVTGGFINFISSYSAMNRVDMTGYFVSDLTRVATIRQQIIQRYHFIKFIRCFIDYILQLIRYFNESILSIQEERLMSHHDLLNYRQQRSENIQLAKTLLREVSKMDYIYESIVEGYDDDDFIKELMNSNDHKNDDDDHHHSKQQQQESKKTKAMNQKYGADLSMKGTSRSNIYSVRQPFDWLLPVDRGLLYYATSKLFSIMEHQVLELEYMQRAYLCFRIAQEKTVVQGGICIDSFSTASTVLEDAAQHRRNIIEYYLTDIKKILHIKTEKDEPKMELLKSLPKDQEEEASESKRKNNSDCTLM